MIAGAFAGRPSDFRCYTDAVRRLIVNADDFGLTAGVNRAIVEAQERGIVTSATLMANARAFEEAATLARSLAEPQGPLQRWLPRRAA